MRAFIYGVRNLWFLLPWVWRFRPWDFWHNYELFMRSLVATRRHIAKHQRHTEWERDVADMDRAMKLWAGFEAALPFEEETEYWNELHDHLKANGRRWWD